MIHTVTTWAFRLGWFAALAPVRVYNDGQTCRVWAVTLAVWLASRTLLRAARHRRTVVS